MDTVIRNGNVVGPGIDSTLDIGIAEGRIVQLGGLMSGETEIDATGRYVLPGGIDAHVHLTAPGAGPGSWHWVDDFEIGTRAAAAGGITCVGNMSFPHGQESMADGVARDLADADAHAIIDHFQHPVLMSPDDVAVDQIEELAAAGHTSIKVFLSFRRFDRNLDGFLRAIDPTIPAFARIGRG